MLKVSLVWQALLHARGGGARTRARTCSPARASTRASGGANGSSSSARARAPRWPAMRPPPSRPASVASPSRQRAPLSERFQAAWRPRRCCSTAAFRPRRARWSRARSSCARSARPGRRALLAGAAPWSPSVARRRGGRRRRDRSRTSRRCGLRPGRTPPTSSGASGRCSRARSRRRLATDALDPDAVVAAIEAAWPGGTALVPLTAHPNPRVRRAAVAPAAVSGHRALVPKLAALAEDPDREVAAAARAATRAPSRASAAARHQDARRVRAAARQLGRGGRGVGSSRRAAARPLPAGEARQLRAGRHAARGILAGHRRGCPPGAA